MRSKEPKVEAPERAQPAEEVYRILILDDDEKVERFKAVCKAAGHSVVPAHTGEEALAFLEETNHADVMLCAAHLENESVFEFLSKVREDEHHEDVPILMVELEPGPLAVKISRSTEQAGRVLGADAFITMPEFDSAQLLGEIEKLLPTLPHRMQDPDASDAPAGRDEA